MNLAILLRSALKQCLPGTESRPGTTCILGDADIVRGSVSGST